MKSHWRYCLGLAANRCLKTEYRVGAQEKVGIEPNPKPSLTNACTIG